MSITFEQWVSKTPLIDGDDSDEVRIAAIAWMASEDHIKAAEQVPLSCSFREYCAVNLFASILASGTQIAPSESIEWTVELRKELVDKRAAAAVDAADSLIAALKRKPV